MNAHVTVPEHIDLIQALPRGASSVGYRARDRRTGAVVVARLYSRLAWLTDAEAAARAASITAAAHRLADVRHPALCGVLCAHECEEGVWVLREWAEGLSLREHVVRRGLLSREEAGRVAAETAAALTALHAAGLRHGALGPSNVFVSPDGAVRIADPALGLAAGVLEIAGVPCRAERRRIPADDTRALAAMRSTLSIGVRVDAGARPRGLYSVPAVAALPTARAARSASPLRVSLRPSVAIGTFGAFLTLTAVALPEQGVRQAAQNSVVRPATVAASAPLSAEPAPVPFTEQDRRFAHLAVRRQGAVALAHPMVAEMLALTEEQRTEVAAAVAAQRDRVEQMVGRCAQGAAVNTVTSMRAIREETRARVMLALDARQRATWEAFEQQPLAPGEPVL